MTKTEKLPAFLRETGLFCCWRLETREGSDKPTKVPYNPKTGRGAQSTNPATFTDLATAERVQGSYDGLGIGIFGDIGAIDIDHCVSSEGEISEMAIDIMQTMNAYTEHSPSGTGLRILFRAEVFQYDRDRYYINNQKLGLEVYIAGATHKYVTVTGNDLSPMPMEERGAELQQVLEKYMVRHQKRAAPVQAVPLDLDDLSLVNKAKNSKNGASFSALWDGDIVGYNSRSEADMALCNALAFWTNKDAGRMDSLFRQSGLMRDKWERQQAGSTYGAITIQNAIESCREGFDPQQYRRMAAVKAFGKKEPPAQERNICEGAAISMDIVKDALHNLGITVRYNVLLKDTEISGLPDHYSTGNALNILPVFLIDYLKSCGIKSATQQAVDGYLACIADENRFNPIEEVLAKAVWDRKDRLAEIYQILGVTAEERKTYIRKWLIQCIALGLNDEESPIGAEGVLVLQGEQGLAKTSFFRALAPHPRWFCEGAVIDVADKDTLLKALAAWITELGELDSTLKREQSALKAFITAPEDRIRTPYAKNASRAPRRTSFCGTVNPKDYLRDETGSRRFWTIPVTGIDKRTLFSLPRSWSKQLWAQVYGLYQENPNGFRLTDAEMKQIQEDNASFAVPLLYETEIRELLDYSMPVGEWQWWKAKDIRRFLPTNADSFKVGRALNRVVSEQQNLPTQHPTHSPPSPPKNPRTLRGTTEYFIPLKHFSPNWGTDGVEGG